MPAAANREKSEISISTKNGQYDCQIKGHDPSITGLKNLSSTVHIDRVVADRNFFSTTKYLLRPKYCVNAVQTMLAAGFLVLFYGKENKCAVWWRSDAFLKVSRPDDDDDD